MSVLSVLVTILPIVVVIAVVLVLVRKTRSAPPSGSAAYDLAGGTGVWFAQVRAPGIRLTTPLNMLSDWGQLQVYGGQVSFTPDGARTPAWTVPVNQIRVQRPGSFATAFNAELPGIGAVTIEPSTNKMARWRSAGSWAGSNYRTTQDVVTILQGWGAH